MQNIGLTAQTELIHPMPSGAGKTTPILGGVGKRLRHLSFDTQQKGTSLEI